MAQKFEKNVRSKTNPAAIAVDTTAVEVTAEDTARIGVLFQNAHATEAIYLGNSDVTSAKGLKLAAGASYYDERSSTAWYGRTATNPSDLRVLVFY